jgi:hypothetical protein
MPTSRALGVGARSTSAAGIASLARHSWCAEMVAAYGPRSARGITATPSALR